MVETMQPAALTIIGVFLGVSTFFMVLRIWARVLQYKSDGTWDQLLIWCDGLLFFSWMLVVTETFVIMKYTIHTWQGYHRKDIPNMSIEEMVTGQRYNLANQLVYHPILTLVKASVICFLLRVGSARPCIRTALITTQVLNAALGLAIFFATMFQCSPFRYMYLAARMDLAAQQAAGADSNGLLNGKLIKGGTCINQIDFFLISAGLTVMTDFMVLIIPTVIVWNLQMARRKKIIAAAILSVGLIVTGVSIARAVIYNWRFSPKNLDRTFGVGYTISAVEANLAIATGCVPSLGPLTRRIFPRLFGSTDEQISNRPAPSSGYEQQPRSREEPYVLKRFGAKMEMEISGWKGMGRTEAWSSDDNILASEQGIGGGRGVEIRKDVKVDVTFADASDGETGSCDGRDADRRSF